MSKRKQAAIEAAKQAAEQKAIQANKEKSSFFRKAKNPIVLAAGIVAVLALGVVGATVGNNTNTGWFNTFNVSTSSAPSATTNPSPSATPQLNREYIYAGSRLLAVEDANAPSSANQPTDLIVWRLVNGAGEWYIRDSTTGTFTSGVFGATGDKPVPADFDGDGFYDFCVYRPSNGTWYIQPNNGGSFYGVQFGISSDVPAPADYDGDGRADVAVWRDISTGSNPATPPSFFILNSSTNTVSVANIGQTGDKAVPADYDGDGRADVAVYRPSTGAWWVKKSNSNGNLVGTTFGNPNETPVAGDFDGDGKFDLAVMRIANNQWIYKSSQSGNNITLSLAMQAGDVPVAGDYAAGTPNSTGDGITDVAVWRPSNGTWYIRLSQNGQLRTDQWGVSGDTPVPAPFRR